ncbi:cadherin repeat domain-containing protein, partial [Vibrio superstes]|uniref:cadherin repeat domain-containing protein n=2 Tax=Vibrio superstes TaxID=198815 RepID=UPI0011BDDBA8
MDSISFAQEVIAGDGWLIVDAQGNLKIAPLDYVPQDGDVILSVGENPLTIPEDIVTELRVSIAQQNSIQSVDAQSGIQSVLDSLEQGGDPTAEDGNDPQSGDDDGSSLTATGAVERDGAQTIATTDFQTDGLFPAQITVEQSDAIETFVIQTVSLLEEPANNLPTIEVTLVNNFIEDDGVGAGDLVARYITEDLDGDTVTVVLSDTVNYELDGDGSVVLTESGAALVNKGEELPPFLLTPSDGIENGEPVTVDPAVTPVNDAPEFISGDDLPGDARNDDVYDFEALNEGTTKGQVVGAVNAFDEDADTLTYSFVDGELTNGVFDIDAETGVITVNKDIDDADLGDFELSVKVVDGNGGEDTAVVNVSLTNVNDAPEFISGDDEPGDAANADVYDFTLAEGSTSGSTVGTVTAFDADDDTLTYSFVDGELTNGVFDIDAETGVITVNKDIDDADL